MARSHYDIDSEMAESFRLSDERAFDYFFRKWYPGLCLYANKIIEDRHVAEEVASSAFVTIWENHNRFEAAGNIKAYLFKVVRNASLKYLQRKRRREKLERAMSAGNEDHNQHLQKMINAELIQELFCSVDELPDGCSRVLKMLYRDGKTVKEIAAELNLSPSTIKTQKVRGISALRKKFISLPTVIFLFLF